ncbi:MAG: ComF family protein [Ferruginibacter sp.]|nr:ComF family protein [Cytophagales bacterium]
MLKDFVSIIFPEYCRACLGPLERNEPYICTTCRFSLPRTNSHLTEMTALTHRFWGRVPIWHSLAYLKFTKGGTVQQLLHQLKYNDQREIGETLGQWYGFELTEHGFAEKFDLILPVPLHASKLRKRGYNQSDCFAKGLSEGMRVAWSPDVLRRTVATPTQTKKKRLERWQNVDAVFEVTNEDFLRGKRILLVDDVVTTGATLEACAQELYRVACAAVSIATIAATT